MPRINLPPLTRGLFLVNLALSALNVSLRLSYWREERKNILSPSGALSATNPKTYVTAPELAIPYLVLVPLKSLKFPWTFLTAALVENNVVSLAVSGLVIWFGGKYLERAWGSTELTKFLLFVTMLPNIWCCVVYGVWHAITSTPDFPTPIQGLVALESAFLVALKQLVPEHTVSLFKGLIRIRIKHFPVIFVGANMLSGPLLGTDTAFWLALTGFLTSWIFLRFYRMSEISSASATGGEGLKMRGDASDTFAFVAFFPDRVHPFLAPVCDGVYAMLVQLKLCTPFSEEAIEAGNENAASRSEGGLPSLMNGRGGGAGGGRRAEAERRRALALKALDQRLNAAAAGAAGRGPGYSASAAGASEESAEAAAGGADEAATVPAPKEDV